jgi:serine O-acetyltransferase
MVDGNYLSLFLCTMHQAFFASLLLFVPNQTRRPVSLHGITRDKYNPPRSALELTRPSVSASDVERDLAFRVEGWEQGPAVLSQPYVSSLVHQMTPSELSNFRSSLEAATLDPLWEQVKLEAQHTLANEPSAGPMLYTLVLSQPSLLEALITICSNEIATEMISATTLQNLFRDVLTTPDTQQSIALDLMASAMRSPSSIDSTALTALLFHQGLHALVCHRLAHALWQEDRTGLAYYLQSTVSRVYSVDIHPAARFGSGIYLNAGSAGVVIGETAVIDHDVTILQGVTLGGTGKERGDRHPKVGRGVILQPSCSVLGNIQVEEGAIVTAKSIATKTVPAFARVSGVPAKVKSFRENSTSGVDTFYRGTTYDIFEKGNECDISNGSAMCTDDGSDLSELEVFLRNRYLTFWNETIVEKR